MKINSLLESQTPSSAVANTASSAPKFGRSDKFLEEKDETVEESTTSGAVASVASPVGKVQSRGSIFGGIKTSEKFPNSQAVKEGDSFGSFAGLKDWQVWNVHVYNNYYRGKYADYGPRLYSVVASSSEEARQVVIDNADYVLQDLLSRKLQSGKKVLPRNSALPVEEKRVGKAEPGSITTVGFKEMLTPEGPMKLKFTGGKIVASQEGQEVEEARVGNRMSDISVGSPKIVHYKGKAVGEVGLDHEASPGNGPYYFHHYLTGKAYVGYDTKQQALADLKHIVMQVDAKELEEAGDTARGQEKLARVHNRAANRVTSKQADKDPAYARKAQQTQNRAWDRLAVKEEGVAEGSDELYQKAIRKYAQRVADDYLGGGNEYLYGANKFDSEMFGVDPKQAQQDFKTLFAQLTKQQGVAEAQLDEVNPHNYDSDEDYYAALRAPARQRSYTPPTRGVDPDDEDYFRAIFRKNKLAQQQKEREADHDRLATGTNEAEELDEKSKSQAQFRMMAAVANNPKFAKKVGIKQSVGKEFHKADKGSDYESLPKKVDEAELAEEMLAHDLYRDLQIFKKGADKDIGSKAKDKEISGKAKDKDIVTKEDCWDGYEQIGMKKKNGKAVPNCVPKK